jgi:hypothetical protein
MRAYPLLGQVGGGWTLELLGFWAPNGTRLSLDAISQGPKNSQIPGTNPLTPAFVMDMHASQTLCTGPYKS